MNRRRTTSPHNKIFKEYDINYKKISINSYLCMKFWSKINENYFRQHFYDFDVIMKMCSYNSRAFVYTGMLPQLKIFSLDLDENVMTLDTPHRCKINHFNFFSADYFLVID
ncbi:hypothetical protein MXB_4263 [Myxobolus squamalis]|nr:hypothetical protein MXB_4263 [Myxobolus squamalis]